MVRTDRNRELPNRKILWRTDQNNASRFALSTSSCLLAQTVVIISKTCRGDMDLDIRLAQANITPYAALISHEDITSCMPPIISRWKFQLKSKNFIGSSNTMGSEGLCDAMRLRIWHFST
ncbi:hypothetical protein EDB19DRAFT_2027049 [Suillus lakei]|nr:hypothetical protein EDB19DRAFT_2027049 [Suillus lakei]